MDNAPQFNFPRLNEPAPAFSARTTHGDRSLEDYRGKWLILFSHPADFTPVCTTEFIGFANAAPKFAEMNCQLLGLSIDSLFSHLAWTGNIKVLKYVSTIDCGTAINPALCEGQTEGGTLNGISYALTEQYLFKNGRMTNASFTDYHIFSMRDSAPWTWATTGMSRALAMTAACMVGEPSSITRPLSLRRS